MERLDGCGAISADVAVKKAQTSALTKRPSKFFEDRVKERPGFVTFPTPGVMFQGGLPLIHQGECVGAIGVSGVQSHEDEQVAQAGVDGAGIAGRRIPRRCRNTSGVMPGLDPGIQCISAA